MYSITFTILLLLEFSNSNLFFFLFFNQDQNGFPGELFAVKMYSLTTDTPKRTHGARSKMPANIPAVIK